MNQQGSAVGETYQVTVELVPLALCPIAVDVNLTNTCACAITACGGNHPEKGIITFAGADPDHHHKLRVLCACSSSTQPKWMFNTSGMDPSADRSIPIFLTDLQNPNVSTRRSLRFLPVGLNGLPYLQTIHTRLAVAGHPPSANLARSSLAKRKD